MDFEELKKMMVDMTLIISTIAKKQCLILFIFLQRK